MNFSRSRSVGTLALVLFGGLPAFASDGPFLDPNQGGQAGELRLVELQFGRLVDVYSQADASAEPVLVYQDVLVRDLLTSEFGKWRFETSLASGREKLILQAENQPGSRDRFDRLLASATRDLQSVLEKSWSSSPPYSRVPRNAALSARFNDLLNPATIQQGQSVRVSLNAEGTEPFEARIIADPNFGGVSAIDGSFQPTRILIDLTISPNEDSGGTPLASNGAGLPEGSFGIEADFALALPTRSNPAAGLFTVLENLGGASLASEFAGPVESGPFGVLEQIRVASAGSSESPSNGFLSDFIPPILLTELGVEIEAVVPDPAGVRGLDFVANVAFGNPAQGFLQPGDGLAFGVDRFARVTDAGSTQQPAALLQDVRFRFESIEPQTVQAGEVAVLRADAQQLAALGLEQEVIRFTPAPNSQGFVDPQASLSLVFSEPMNPDFIRPYENLTVTRVDQAPTAYDYVPISVQQGGLLDRVQLVPALPFAHSANGEDYFLNVSPSIGAGFGVADLSGNALQPAVNSIPFQIDPAAEVVQNGGLALRFAGVEEDGQVGGDLRGQAFYDLSQGLLFPRPVVRFSGIVDSANPIFGSMQPIVPIKSVLSNLGAKTHLMWRYADLGQTVDQRDDVFNNLDVEGLALAPGGGAVSQTFYPEFEIRLGHASLLPDESLDSNLLPKYSSSGLTQGVPFAENFVEDGVAGSAVVHSREKGYFVAQTGVFQSQTGTAMLRLPLNTSAELSDFETYTWRDTASTVRAGLDATGTQTAGSGVPLEREVDVLGIGASVEPGSQFGRPGALAKQGIPTVGLPLLMELSCFPSAAVSLNTFGASLAQVTSVAPSFRAFSEGGFNVSGNPVIKDPDLELVPSGGFNGNPVIGQVGAPTSPYDPIVNQGQADFVTRVSRVHTAFLPAQGLQNPDWKGAIADAIGGLPEGTSIELAFRGHDAAPTPSIPLSDATTFDVYGDLAEGDLSDDAADFFGFSPTNEEWTDDLDDLDGVQLVQVRITFTGNIETMKTPSLDTLVLYWE